MSFCVSEGERGGGRGNRVPDTLELKLQAAMNESPCCDCLLGTMLMLLLTCVITFWEVIMSLTQCCCFHWRHKEIKAWRRKVTTEWVICPALASTCAVWNRKYWWEYHSESVHLPVQSYLHLSVMDSRRGWSREQRLCVYVVWLFLSHRSEFSC